jgi:hypothetical protein
VAQVALAVAWAVGKADAMSQRTIDRAVLGALWVAWLLVAVIGGRAVGDALADHSRAVRLTGTIGAWAGWGIAALAMVVPAAATLTALRVLVPGGLAVAAAVAFERSAGGVDTAVLAGLAAVATLIALAGETGRVFVQASAYGDEQRFPLRPPFGYLVVAVAAWVLFAVASLSGPLLLAARAWVPGAVLTLLALGGSVTLPRRWHRLSRRWLVFVPAGVVIHDPLVLADTVMMRSHHVVAMCLAPADTGAADLTGPATGTALEIEVGEVARVVFAPTGREPHGRAIHASAMLVAPTRPGAALRAAADRHLSVG